MSLRKSRRRRCLIRLIHRCASVVDTFEAATDICQQEDRRTSYLDLVRARWGTEWTSEFSHNRFLPAFQQDPETSRHAMVREFSLTLVKHFAIMSAWTSLEEASKLLKHRVVQRRRDQKFRKNGQAGHITAADIKCVLLEEVKLPSAGMSWASLRMMAFADSMIRWRPMAPRLSVLVRVRSAMCYRVCTLARTLEVRLRTSCWLVPHACIRQYRISSSSASAILQYWTLIVLPLLILRTSS